MTTTLPTTPGRPVPASSAETDDPRALHLVSVLASGLPHELGTGAEPALYTVPVVFSRQVSPEERLKIEDPATARALAERTGASDALALVVEDRRLLVENTNLGELEAGLAVALGELVTALSDELLTASDRRSAEAGARQLDERERLEKVSQAAARIRFDAPGAAPSGEGETGRSQ